MSILYEERPSDSPFIDSVMRGRTVGDGSTVRPAEVRWHMVFTKHLGQFYPFVVGPWTTSGVANFTEGAEILWVRFKLGAFMPHLPTRNFLNSETILPGAAAKDSFWLHGSAWQFPDFENVETFVDRLAREETLVRDPLVESALRERLPEIPSRTLRHRFLRVTGLSQNHIRQFERAQRAAALLGQGHPILDTVYELGYFDQPHMTRAVKQVIGLTPGQIVRGNEPE
jgi:AraC-like DNA-binding protein